FRNEATRRRGERLARSANDGGGGRKHCARQRACSRNRRPHVAMPAAAGVFVHAQALCESEQVGEGTRIWAFAHVMKRAVVGRNCNIGDHAFLDAGARIGDRVTIKNQATVWEGVEIEDDVFVGPAVSFTNDIRPRSARMTLPTVAERYGQAKE